MSYQILTGEQMGRDFLPRVMEIDRICYEQEYVGELSKMEARYDRNPRSFVCVMDGEKPAGYINFFPVGEALWEEIVETGMKIRDDDIRPDEMADYSREKENHLFIISVAVLPEYRKDKEVIVTLSNGFVAYLNQLEAEGFHIGGLAGTAVSEGGKKFLRSRMFRLYREIEDGNQVYLCDGPYLKKLLANDLYFKTHKEDVYLFLPYADNVKNTRLRKLLEPEEEREVPEVPAWLLSALDDCLNYEYENDLVSELKRIYIGDFQFLHTLDEYEDEEDHTVRPYIVGEEKVYLSLFAHPSSHMYVLMLFFPDCRYSTSQLEDQLSHGYLKIRRPEDMDERGFYRYQDLNAYLRREYGLLLCGRGKSLLCMSDLPVNEGEFYNILTAEAYNSMHQDFHIRYPRLKEMAEQNRAVYDYYEAYMTEDVVAMVLYDYASLTQKERIELTATYAFIAELVIFQNTALNKMTVKVSNALANEGDVSYQYISQLYRDYAKTIRFWQSQNFRYYGTQREADQIREAFGNDELRRNYYEQQEFLEHMVDLKNAQVERKNGLIINIVAIVLAVIQVQGYLVDLLSRFYEHFGIPVESASSTFDVMVIGGGGLIFLVWYILYRKHFHVRKKKLSEIAVRKEL